MAQREIYLVQVQETLSLSPNFKRIVFGGPSLDRFPDGFEGGYVKLLLKKSHQEEAPTELRDFLKRSFTVRSFHRGQRRLTLDFALHETEGPALRWAQEAKPGDEIKIAGPGPVKMLNHDADSFFLAGDMTALPAISVNLARLPESAVGYALIEVGSSEDQLELQAPPGKTVEWIVAPATRTSLLAKAARKAPWPGGRVSAWVACEFSAMKELRDYLISERQVARDDLYVSSYWKRGATDEEHKAAKKAALATG